MDMDYGRFLGHPADPRTPELPDYAVSQATEHVISRSAHWMSFLDFSRVVLGDAEVKSWSIKLEDICDCDTAQLLVLALTGTNEQAAAARLYLAEAFIEHHSELIDTLATSCDDAHDGGPDEWEAA